MKLRAFYTNFTSWASLKCAPPGAVNRPVGRNYIARNKFRSDVDGRRNLLVSKDTTVKPDCML